MARKKSILVNPDAKQCYFCGSWNDPEWHHVMHGTANRKIADKWGLTVWLCRSCHAALHDSPDIVWRNKDRFLKEISQERFEEKYGHDKWMELFGKNYLNP